MPTPRYKKYIFLKSLLLWVFKSCLEITIVLHKLYFPVSSHLFREDNLYELIIMNIDYASNTYSLLGKWEQLIWITNK